MPVPFLNQTTGQIESYNEQDLTPEALQSLTARGLRPASPEDVANRERTLQYSTTAQQALAQAERVVRGGTLGLVEGFGSEEDVRARAEVSQEVSPVTSFVADLAPDIALSVASAGAAGLATGAGRAAAKAAAKGGTRAALAAAAEAAPVAALAGESVASGAVTAAQQAYQEGRSFLDDPVQDAENMLLWGGINGVLGGAPMAFRAARGGLKGEAKAAAEVADQVDLEQAAKAGEQAAGVADELPAVPVAEAAGPSTTGVPLTSDEGTQAVYRAREAAGAQDAPVEMPRAVGGEEFPAAAPQTEEFSIAGMSHEDLGADKFRPGVIEGLRADPEFARTGIPAESAARIAKGRKDIAPDPKPKAIPVEEAMPKVEKGVARAEREAMRSQADDIAKRILKGEEPKGIDGYLRDARLAQYQPEIIDTATKEMKRDLDELNKLSQGIRERAVKQEDVAKNIADNLPAQQAKARDIALAGRKLAGEIRADAHALAASMGKKNPTYFSGTARDLVSSLIERSKAISEMTDGAQIFNALDDLKRVVDNHKVALEAGSRKSAKDPLSYQRLIPMVEDYANTIRQSLEDVSTFGRAGEMQKAYNATYHQKWFPAKQVFEDSVFKRTGRDYKAFDVLDAWESKITSLLQDAGTGERRHVGDMLGALKEMAEQRAKYGTAPKGETDRIVALVDKIERTFKLADDTRAAKERLQSLSPVAEVAGQAVGGVLGGLPGAFIGGAIAKGANELATGRFRRAFNAMRGATDEAVERSVDDWIAVSTARGAANDNSKRGLFRRMKKPQLSPADADLAKRAARVGTTLGFAQFLGDNDDPQAAFIQKRDALLDDEGFLNRFSDEYGDLAVENPTVYALAAGKAGEARKFLVDRLPSSVAVSMARPNGYPPTNEAIEDWSVYWNAATNPRTVIQSLSRGDVRPAEVETLRTLYRPLYEKLQMTLLDKISRATEMGTDLDDQFVMRMSMLFDLDGAGSPAFSQRAADTARQVQQAQAQQHPQGGKPMAPKAGTRISPSNVAITGPTYGSLG